MKKMVSTESDSASLFSILSLDSLFAFSLSYRLTGKPIAWNFSEKRLFFFFFSVIFFPYNYYHPQIATNVSRLIDPWYTPARPLVPLFSNTRNPVTLLTRLTLWVLLFRRDFPYIHTYAGTHAYIYVNRYTNNARLQRHTHTDVIRRWTLFRFPPSATS